MMLKECLPAGNKEFSYETLSSCTILTQGQTLTDHHVRLAKSVSFVKELIKFMHK
jgi:hypothetical protein